MKLYISLPRDQIVSNVQMVKISKCQDVKMSQSSTQEPREMAQSKSHIGISPSGPKIGLRDQSQSSVQSIIGIDPNVMKKRVWELSQRHVQTVIGIDPNRMKNKTLG